MRDSATGDLLRAAEVRDFPGTGHVVGVDVYSANGDFGNWEYKLKVALVGSKKNVEVTYV